MIANSLGKKSVPEMIRERGRDPEELTQESVDYLVMVDEKVKAANKKHGTNFTVDSITRSSVPGAAAAATPSGGSKDDDG